MAHSSQGDGTHGSPERWDDGSIWVVCMGVGGAVEIALTIIEGTVGWEPVGGSHIAQMGAVFGAAVVAAMMITIRREIQRRCE